MALFGLLFLGVVLVLAGVGIAIGLVACVLVGALLGLGVISSSLFVGVRSGRRAGFRLLLVQCGFWGGLPAGVVCVWCAQSFVAGYGSGWPALAFGAAGGAVAGVIVALLFDLLLARLYAWGSIRPVSPASPSRIA
jgi:hypothetical protein